MNEIDTAMGLHEIPKAAMSLTRINSAINQLLADLPTFIANTEHKAQRREEYLIRREGIGAISPGTGYEIRIERALWSKYHQQVTSDAMPFLPTCSRIAGYSVALFSEQEQANWGEVDLLGVSSNGLPIPIELKQDTGDNILKMIVQVAAYGVAVRHLWNLTDSPFRRCWNALSFCPDTDMPLSGQNHMAEIECICLATKAYWDRAFGRDGERRTAGQIMDDSWGPINNLVQEFRNQKLNISFAAVFIEPDLPTITSCSTITLRT
jgi:hypothetical protein